MKTKTNMKTKKFEAIVEINETGNVNVFSGLPQNEPFVTWPLSKHRGTLTPFINGDMSFSADAPCGIIPPAVDLVFRQGDVTVKRSSRNYIVTMKVPVIESADDTKRKFSSMLKGASAAISDNRATIKDSM